MINQNLRAGSAGVKQFASQLIQSGASDDRLLSLAEFRSLGRQLACMATESPAE